MKSFLARHASDVKGVLSGFDRVRFRGTLRLIANSRGLARWLAYYGVLYKSFTEYAQGLTNTMKEATRRLAEKTGRPLRYLPSSSLRKEDIAREIAERDGIAEGLVCVLTAVEPCKTFAVRRNRQKKLLELRSLTGKCLHHYFYLIDPQLGWLNVRVQTWFPFSVHIVINGREWLARDLRKQGLAYEQRDNCFVDLADVPRAQRLLDRQLRTNWTRLLNRLLRQVHPAHRRMFPEPLNYYWSADETEWATDVMFRSPEQLAALYPRLVRHAVTSFAGNDVLRFLGRAPSVRYFRTAELLSDLAVRPEGTRIKHELNRNSIKMYDKQQSVLRVETTINNPTEMKSYRAAENDPHGPKGWRRLRKGVADLHRRAQISQKSNARYLDSLAAVDTPLTLAQSTASLCQRIRQAGRSVRALNPLGDDDARLLEAVHRGEFAILGFRNRDLCPLLFPSETSLSEKQRMTKVTRMLRLLRAHGLISKVSCTHRYQLTPRGQTAIPALLAARAANTHKLNEIAA